MFKKITLIISVFIMFNCSVQANINSATPLKSNEVLQIEAELLKDALKYKNWDDVAGVGISFFATSVSGQYDGNSDELKKRAIELINLSVDNGSLIGGNFIMIVMLPIDKRESHKMAKKMISKHQDKINSQTQDTFYGIIMTLATTTLDLYQENQEELNFALESLELVKDTPEARFFKAFMYQALGAEELAEVYLNSSCNETNDPKILETCKEFLD